MIFVLRQKLNLDSRHAPSIHFDHLELKIAKVKALSALRNETELVEHKSTDGGVSRIFGERDVVLRIEVAHAESGVKDNRSIGQRQRPFDHVKLVVNFANKLLQNVFHRQQAEYAAELVHND